MSGHVSPFAELTGVEKQIKWLEYQTARLPYTNAPMEAAEAEPPKAQTRRVATPPPEITMAGIKAKNMRGASPADFQKTRHRQYDAVIARMKQAERMANNFQPSERK